MKWINLHYNQYIVNSEDLYKFKYFMRRINRKKTITKLNRLKEEKYTDR